MINLKDVLSSLIKAFKYCFTGMAWSGCGEGYGGQNSVDRRNVQIRGEPRLEECVWLGGLETVCDSKGCCGYSAHNGGDGGTARTVHQDLVYPSR